MKKNYPAHFLTRFLAILCAILFSFPAFSQTNLGWIQKAGFPGPARHRAVGAAVNNRGYMGLGHINSIQDILFDDWFEYDPGTDSWMQKANFPGGPRMHATSFVINNKIYVGTGRDVNSVLYNDFYCYDPAANSWVQVANYPGAARRGAVSFVVNNLGYVGTGSYHSNFYKYNPATDTWSPVASLPGSGRISAVAFAINGKGYLTTGDDGGPNADMWEYDPTFDTWTPKANLPGLPRMEACGFAMNGKGFVGTGDNYSSGTNYQDFWSFDPATNSWMQVADFSGAARRYMTTFVIGNRAYAGLGTSGINYADLWEYGTISGVEENTSAHSPVEIYPNPVHETTMLKFPVVKNAELKILDISGKTVAAFSNLSGNEFQLERNGIPAGIYFVTLSENSKIISTSKIIFE
jgi:N-acetylneuraminic acid mutarotase